MSSRIEEIIDEMEEYIASCKYQPLSNTKIIVNREEIEDMVRELRVKTPEEVKRYQKIIANRDAILSDAEQKAEAMVQEAQETSEKLTNEHEITKNAAAMAEEIVNTAKKQGEEILARATAQANTIRTGAIDYTDDLLATLQGIIGDTIDSAGAKYGNLLKSLQDCYDVVNSNRAELHPQQDPSQGSESED